MVWRKGRVSLDVRAQSLRRALVERHPIGLTPGNFAWRDRRKLLARHGNRRALPPGLLPTPAVFGVTSRAAVGVSDIEDGLFVPIIVQGGHPVRPPVHDRMVASQVTVKSPPSPRNTSANSSPGCLWGALCAAVSGSHLAKRCF